MSYTAKEIIEGYIKLRDARDELKRKHRDELAPYNDKMQKMELFLLGELNRLESDSIAIKGVGTAFKSTRTSSKVEDWETTLDAIKEHELWHMLERRISKAALEEYIEANGDTLPGVSINREITVNVRRN